MVTDGDLALVVIAILRWIEHLSDLGGVSATAAKVEAAPPPAPDLVAAVVALHIAGIDGSSFLPTVAAPLPAAGRSVLTDADGNADVVVADLREDALILLLGDGLQPRLALGSDLTDTRLTKASA